MYSVFTNDFCIRKAQMSMYADDSTIYLGETTINDLNIHLNQEMKLVLDWIDQGRAS